MFLVLFCFYFSTSQTMFCYSTFFLCLCLWTLEKVSEMWSSFNSSWYLFSLCPRRVWFLDTMWECYFNFRFLETHNKYLNFSGTTFFSSLFYIVYFTFAKNVILTLGIPSLFIVSATIFLLIREKYTKLVQLLNPGGCFEKFHSEQLSSC